MSRLGTESAFEVLAARLVDEAGVAVLAGTAFGARGDGYPRLSSAGPAGNPRAGRSITEAVTTIYGTLSCA